VIQTRYASLRAGFLCTWVAVGFVPAQWARAVSFGGNAAITTDYIYRGYSETNNKGAVQLDLHAGIQTGTFAGVFASTLDSKYRPYASYELEEYIGQRFDLNSAWNTSITATNYQYVGGNQYYSSDYQQITASVSYLDRWTLSFAAIPNMLRYWGPEIGYYRAGRYAAYDVETSGQWLIGNGFFVTGGAGYYLFTGSNDPSGDHQPSIGYAYGNVGVAYEWRNLRLDVGFFLTQKASAQQLFPYPSANDRFAGTLSWRF
jgi:uncharacterized protein (TIGR02001 family)